MTSGNTPIPTPELRRMAAKCCADSAEVVMMVRDPLVGGESYRVDMTVNGNPYTWSFTVLK